MTVHANAEVERLQTENSQLKQNELRLMDIIEQLDAEIERLREQQRRAREAIKKVIYKHERS